MCCVRLPDILDDSTNPPKPNLRPLLSKMINRQLLLATSVVDNLL
jgi:hypothetical protein